MPSPVRLDVGSAFSPCFPPRISKTDYDPVVLSRASELHTGAEIEAAFVEALHRGFAEERDPAELDLGEVLSESVPLATTTTSPLASGRASQLYLAGVDKCPNRKYLFLSSLRITPPGIWPFTGAVTFSKCDASPHKPKIRVSSFRFHVPSSLNQGVTRE